MSTVGKEKASFTRFTAGNNQVEWGFAVARFAAPFIAGFALGSATYSGEWMLLVPGVAALGVYSTYNVLLRIATRSATEEPAVDKELNPVLGWAALVSIALLVLTLAWVFMVALR